MESIFKTILTFLGNTFGNQASGLKPGGILSTGLFTAIGFGVGGIPGLIIGIIVGLLTGGSINTMVDKFLGNSAPETLRIDPNPQDLSKKTRASVGGKFFDLDRPNLEHLKAPWGKGEEGPAHFLGPLEQDTDRLIGDPIDSQPSKAILDKTVGERNHAYYDYISSAELLNDKLTHYNKEVRAEWMKTLGIDEKSPLAQTGAPPVYTPLALKLPEEAEREVRTHLGIDEGEWQKLPAATKLSRMEESLRGRLNSLANDFANAAKEYAPFEGKADFDFNRVNPLGWPSGMWTYMWEGSEKTRAEAIVDSFFKDHDEEKFKKAMEGIAAEEAGGVFSGAKRAEVVRKTIPLICEEDRLNRQWMAVQHTKWEWANQADDWFAKLPAEDAALTDYLARYDNNARIGKDFSIVREETFAITGPAAPAPKSEGDDLDKAVDAERRKRAGRSPGDGAENPSEQLKRLEKDELEQTQAAKGAMEKAIKLMEKLKVTDTKDMKPLSADDIQAIGDWPADKDGLTLGVSPKALKDIQDKATAYNEKVQAYQNGLASTRNDASARDKELREVHQAYETLMIYVSGYADNIKQMNDAFAKVYRQEETDLASKNNAGTPLEGVEGCMLTVADKRPGKENQSFLLFGFKAKDGTYTITAWERHDASGAVVDSGQFGATKMDMKAGMKLNAAQPDGLNQIIQKIEACAQARGAAKGLPSFAFGTPADRPANSNLPLSISGLTSAFAAA